MENYIVINGKKAELTKEQLENLGIKPKRNNPFNKVLYGEIYTSISANGGTTQHYDYNDQFDIDNVRNANYFNDKEFAKQVALTQLLYRKLLKYSYDNDSEDTKWDKSKLDNHYIISYDSMSENFIVSPVNWLQNLTGVYFSIREVAENAIRDIIKPFIEKYPEFKNWILSTGGNNDSDK